MPDIHQERIDLLSGMVRDLRARLAVEQARVKATQEEKHELAALVLRVLGDDERPAIRVLVRHARAVGEG